MVVVVPLFVDNESWQSDFSWMDSATGEIAANLSAGGGGMRPRVQIGFGWNVMMPSSRPVTETETGAST